jgi:hypothetical protein
MLVISNYRDGIRVQATEGCRLTRDASHAAFPRKRLAESALACATHLLEQMGSAMHLVGLPALDAHSRLEAQASRLVVHVRSAGYHGPDSSVACATVLQAALACQLGATHTSSVITELRARVARVLALCVFVITFGYVQVNPSGMSTESDPGRDDASIAAKREP